MPAAISRQRRSLGFEPHDAPGPIELDGLGEIVVLRIVADDLTGALDSAAPFAAAGGSLPVYWDPTLRSGSYALDTETREGSGDSGEWVAHLHGAELSYKKIDSLLRGRTAKEIVACLVSGRFQSAIIAPAFPAQDRITRMGRQYWRQAGQRGWQPVDVDLLLELRRSLPIVHAKSDKMLAADGFFLCDAEAEEQLDAFVAAGRRMTGPMLWCGSAGLARALAGPARPQKAFTPRAPLLLLIGSDHGVSRAQREAIEAHRPGLVTRLRSTGQAAIEAGVTAVADRIGQGVSSVLAVAPPTGSRGAARTLRATALALVATKMPRPGSLFATGGATLYALLQALGAASLLATGELTPGVALSRIQGSRWHDLPVVSKSGGFGAPDLLIRLAESVIP
jgi:D-threonate/D-erythronate kinase